MFFIVMLTFISILCRKVQSDDEVPIIQTKFGAIRGVYTEDSNGQYYFYMGIPFGRPPKDNYFGDPVDPDSWSGVYEANSDESKCPQRVDSSHALVGNPNCLHLNVYVPANKTSTKPFSVLYWIYGGNNTDGYAGRYMWGPELLIRNDIIMVTANYRVGPYGFMCLGTKEIPGNAGVKDVLKALRWVHDNISGFGGNPKDVTIGGSSSGSSMVEILIVSPLAKGLFHRAIQQSGSKTIFLNNMNSTSHEAVLHLALYFGFKGDVVSEYVEFLNHIDPLDLIFAVEELNLNFKECVEPIFEGVEAFFTQGHTETVLHGNYSGVDTLMGVTCNEKPIEYEMNEIVVSIIIDLALDAFMVDDEDKFEVGKTVLQFYKGSKPLNKHIQTEMTNLMSDYGFVLPMLLSMQHRLRGNNSIYFYEFCYSGNRNYGKLQTKIEIDGAMHTDELGYLFNQDDWGDINCKDQLIIDRMTKMWTNFIKYGNPTPEETELLPVKWLPIIQNELQHYLKINTELSMDVDLKHERMAFWNLLMISYFKIWKV